MAEKRNVFTRFATLEDVLSDEFACINKILDGINVKYCLPNHSVLNQERFPWSNGLLSIPSFYASRMWEYPFAILSSDLKDGLKCLDIGCGMTPFSIYLKEVAKCNVIGLDPDLFATGVKYGCHGVSREFLEKTGLEIKEGNIEDIPFPSDSVDRVFCISVIEHLRPDVTRNGAIEIARVLRPGGRAVITIDVNLISELSRPLDLVWDSGLIPLGDIDLRWPSKRFGIFCDKKQPADVFGLTLVKPEDYYVETVYDASGQKEKTIHGSLIPSLRKPSGDFRKYDKLLKLYRVLPDWLKVLIRRLFRKEGG